MKNSMQQSDSLEFSFHFYQNVQCLQVSGIANESVCNPFSIYKVVFQCSLRKGLDGWTGFETYYNYICNTAYCNYCKLHLPLFCLP